MRTFFALLFLPFICFAKHTSEKTEWRMMYQIHGFKGSYIDVTKDLCKHKKLPKWLLPGKHVRLYGAKDTMIMRVGKAETEDTFMGQSVCSASIHLDTPDEMKWSGLAVPKRASQVACSLLLKAESSKELAAFPAAAKAFVNEIWAKPASFYDPQYPKSKEKLGDLRYNVTEDEGKKKAWYCKRDKAPAFVLTQVNVGRSNGPWDDRAFNQRGWLEEQGKVIPANGECTEGYFMGIYEINGDGKIQILLNTTPSESPFEGELCQWDGKRFILLKE